MGKEERQICLCFVSFSSSASYTNLLAPILHGMMVMVMMMPMKMVWISKVILLFKTILFIFHLKFPMFDMQLDGWSWGLSGYQRVSGLGRALASTIGGSDSLMESVGMVWYGMVWYVIWYGMV